MEIIDKIFETNLKKEKVKTQILLTHTGRNIIDLMGSFKFRFSGVPIRLPHYLINRSGSVIKVLDDLYNSNLDLLINNFFKKRIWLRSNKVFF